MKRIFAILVACCFATATLAWDGGGNYNQSLDNRTTNLLIHQLKQQFQRCSKLTWTYRYDCYDDAYYRTARSISQNPAYAPAEDALRVVGEKITAIVEQNVDPSQPVLRKGLETYRPIKKSAQPAAKEQVAAAIEEARTVLLRTPENGGDNFQRIAAALESNKILLRSTLLMIGRALRFA